jgi:transposase
MRAACGPASTEQTPGALPAVAGFCRRLDIAGIINRAAPVREIARATHWQVIEALIANRLTSPSPMVHVGAWARRLAVAHVLGLAPDVLNDDRIARALDALAPVLEQVTGSVGAAAISRFGIEVSQIHWDMTSVSLHGAYEHPEEDYPQPKFGHPKDRRADLKQIQAGVATAADGAVPVFWQPYSGGAGEVCQVTGAMEALRKLAGPRRFLLAGDSKLLSYANIAAMTEAQVSFLAPASKAFVPASVLAGCGYNAADPVDYTAGRDAGRPEASRGRYHVAEDTMTITGPRKKDPSYTLRRVFVHSSASTDAAGRARARKLEQAAGDLDRLTRGLGSRHYPDAADITAAQVLARYKNQPTASERRYHDLKGPLAVAPMFLHANRRITAIIGVICMALLIYSLIERQARRNLAPASRLDGLYAGRPAKPTASLILTALATLRLRAGTDDRPPQIPQPDPVQQQLLNLLEIDPRKLADSPDLMCELRV